MEPWTAPPKGQEKRQALALEIGADGFVLLDALNGPDVPAVARELPMVQTLRDVWRVHYTQGDGPLRWRSAAELPPVAERMQSSYDPQGHFSMKRQLSWTGYKVHVTETCDDDAAHLITHVKTCLSMQPDMTSTAEIHEQLAVIASWRSVCEAAGGTTAFRSKDPSGVTVHTPLPSGCQLRGDAGQR